MTPEEMVVAVALEDRLQATSPLRKAMEKAGFTVNADKLTLTPAGARLIAMLKLDRAREALQKAQIEVAHAEGEVYGKEVANE